MAELEAAGEVVWLRAEAEAWGWTRQLIDGMLMGIDGGQTHTGRR